MMDRSNLILHKHLTLGKLIEALEDLGDTEMPTRLTDPHSYRGYYAQLAFTPLNRRCKASDNALTAKECLNQSFQHPRGIEYAIMDHDTPVWMADYGSSAGAGYIIGIIGAQFALGDQSW